MKIHYFLILFSSLLTFNCKDSSDPAKFPDHSILKIVLTDSLDVVESDGLLNVPESIRELSDVIVSDASKCDRVFVLDPSLVRVDQPKEFSLATKIEKGGAKNTSHPKVISKLIGKHLDEVNVPDSFVKATGTSYQTPAQLQKWLASQVPNDSILVYNPDGPEKYSLGKRTYPTFADIEGVREHIRNALCKNDKANFTLLFNPPVGKMQPPGDPNLEPHVARPGGSKEGHRPPIRPAHPIVRMNGICDPATHHLHEQIFDENGRPQRGKVLVMNCKECGYTGNN